MGDWELVNWEIGNRESADRELGFVSGGSMRKDFVVLVLLVMLSACAGPVPVSAPTMTLPPPTATIAIPTSTSTKIPTPTEVVETIIIDVTKPSSEWDLSSLPEEKRTAIEHWLSDPYNSTPEEKQIADGFLTKQWQLTLETDATGKDLYAKIVVYAQSHGGEVGLIPNSLHLQVRTDKDNLIVYGPAPGMDKYVHTSWYGFGVGMPNPNIDYLQKRASFINQIDFYGSTVLREGNTYPLTPDVSIEGDIVGLFEIPSLDINIASGAIVSLNGRYIEAQIQFTNGAVTNSHDMCMFIHVGALPTGETCSANIFLQPTQFTPFDSLSVHKPLSRDQVISILEQSDNKLHVVFSGKGLDNNGEFGCLEKQGRLISGVWQNGMLVITAVVIYSNIPIP